MPVGPTPQSWRPSAPTSGVYATRAHGPDGAARWHAGARIAVTKHSPSVERAAGSHGTRLAMIFPFMRLDQLNVSDSPQISRRCSFWVRSGYAQDVISMRFRRMRVQTAARFKMSWLLRVKERPISTSTAARVHEILPISFAGGRISFLTRWLSDLRAGFGRAWTLRCKLCYAQLKLSTCTDAPSSRAEVGIGGYAT